MSGVTGTSESSGSVCNLTRTTGQFLVGCTESRSANFDFDGVARCFLSCHRSVGGPDPVVCLRGILDCKSPPFP